MKAKTHLRNRSASTDRSYRAVSDSLLYARLNFFDENSRESTGQQQRRRSTSCGMQKARIRLESHVFLWVCARECVATYARQEVVSRTGDGLESLTVRIFTCLLHFDPSSCLRIAFLMRLLNTLQSMKSVYATRDILQVISGVVSLSP